VFFIGSTPTQSITLSVPAGIPAGTMLFAQAVALIQPLSLPNGENPFGAVTSNGIASYISGH
jgi:hypothetical protein